MTVIAFRGTTVNKARAVLAQYSGSYATPDPARLLADSTMDAIYICTQHASHAPLSVHALAASKAVFAGGQWPSCNKTVYT